MRIGRTRRTYYNSIAVVYVVGAVPMTPGEFRLIAFMMAAPLPKRHILVEHANATTLFSPRH